MQTVYDFVTVICFICIVVTYFMFTEGGMKILAHFMLPAVASQSPTRSATTPETTCR